ncbi:MAG: hypothetical protein ACLTDP_08165 [Terrisporobacter sp.]
MKEKYKVWIRIVRVGTHCIDDNKLTNLDIKNHYKKGFKDSSS